MDIEFWVGIFFGGVITLFIVTVGVIKFGLLYPNELIDPMYQTCYKVDQTHVRRYERNYKAKAVERCVNNKESYGISTVKKKRVGQE